MAPPTAPGDPSDDAAVAAYQNALRNYQSQVSSIQNQINTLNEQSKEIASKIDDLQGKVQQLQGSDLPNAQRQDAQRQEDQLKQRVARHGYESAAKTEPRRRLAAPARVIALTRPI